MRKTKRNWLGLITLGAMLVALSIILTRLLPIYIGTDKRIAFGDAPIMLAGIWFGPIGGGLVGLVADVLGSLISGLGWYPPLTIPAVLVGVIPGILRMFFLKGGVKFVNVGLMALIGNAVTAMGLTTYLLNTLYGTDFFVLLVPRVAISLLITAVETVAITVILRTLGTSPSFIEGRRRVYMTKEDALKYIHSVSWMGSRPGLVRTRELLKRLGDPQDSLEFIHIAGTNGKGSVASMIYNILLKANIKAGLYTSPYIESFNERIQAMGSVISDDELAYVTQIVKHHADKMKNKPTEFELITCIAFEYFKRRGVSLVVLEVGLGGELDSTNVIKTPAAAVITAMSYDHMQVLGDSMIKIAAAKAGIIKKGGDVVSYGNDKIAEEVFEETAKVQNARIIHPDFSQIKTNEYGLWGQSFAYKQFENLRITLAGAYQVKNAAVAIETALLLRNKGYTIRDKSIEDGLAAAEWSSRFEVIGQKPVIIVDGAHNPDGIGETAQSLRKLFRNEKIIFVMGVMADKDIDAMMPHIVPLANRFYTVTPDNPRAMQAEQLAYKLSQAGAIAEPCTSIKEAALKARRAAGENGVICALGSLYMAADIKKAFSEE